MTEFYAQPYSIEQSGFYFDSFETFEAGMQKLNKRGCEEVEIQLIDGDDHLVRLANAASLHQGDIEFWFEELDDLDQTEAVQTMVLLDIGYSLRDAPDRHNDVCLYEGSASDYAYDLINETCEVPDYLRHYIDYDAIARDMEINGEITVIHHELIVTNPQDF